MKILHVETGMHLYGGALQVLYLLKGLAKEGCENLLACPEGSAVADAAGGYADIHRMHLGGELDFRVIRRLSSLIAENRPDIVHLHSRRGADLWGGAAARLSGVPCVLSRRVDNPEPRWLVRWKYRMYDKVIAISRGIVEVLVREGVPPEKLECVPSAIDADAYTASCRREWFREEFGLDPRVKTAGVIAQFIPRKGHRWLMEAVPGILKKHPEMRFLFFGQGPLGEDLRRRSGDLSFQKTILFPGFRNDLERILPCLDLVIHPVEMEGLGVSLLQAAASGVPLIASGAGGIPEIIEDGVNGYLVPPRDPEALASAVVRLLEDPEKARSMGESGRRIVREKFSVEAMVRGNLGVYRELLGAGRR
jgi:glycosyltransferase involved in cell wall biosynthesis